MLYVLVTDDYICQSVPFIWSRSRLTNFSSINGLLDPSSRGGRQRDRWVMIYAYTLL